MVKLNYGKLKYGKIETFSLQYFNIPIFWFSIDAITQFNCISILRFLSNLLKIIVAVIILKFLRLLFLCLLLPPKINYQDE